MRRGIDRYRNPVLAWSDLAWKMAEMSIASASVIGHRTNQIAKAGVVPGARDRSEFARMASEKIEASMESAAALGRRGTATHINHSARTFGLMLQSTAALVSLYGSQNSSQFFARQAKLTRTLTQLTGSAIDLSNSAAKLATLGLAPIHSRAVANASRLVKR
jgi:predicted metal-binding membrane protein